MDIKLVEAFVQLMRSGSLSRAERDSGIPKATLSRQVTRLEEVLGVQLVVRTTRRLTPTEAGHAFHAQGEHLLAQLQEGLASAHAEVQEMVSGDSGGLALLTDTHFSTTFLCGMIGRYREKHPNVRCTLAIADRPTSPAIADVDCYLCSKPPDHPNLIAKSLGRLGHSLYASPSYLARHGTPVHPRELGAHAAVFLREREARPGQGVTLHGRDTAYTWHPRIVADTNDYWVLKTFCFDGLGLALLPDFFCHPEVEAGGLCRVLPQWHPEPLRAYAVYRKQRFMTSKLRSFIEMMASCFEDNEITSLHSYVGSAKPAGPAPARTPAR